MTKSELMRAIYRLSNGTNVEYIIVFENQEGKKMSVAFTELHDNHKEVVSNIGG